LDILSLSDDEGRQGKGEKCWQTVGSSNEASSEQVPEILHCWIDAVSPGLAVAACSLSFTQLFGLVSGTAYDFLDWVSDPDAFEFWVKLFAQDGATDSALVLVLRSQGLYDSGMEIHAQCTVDCATWSDFDAMVESILLAEEQVEQERLLVHLMLHHVRAKEMPSAPQIRQTLLML